MKRRRFVLERPMVGPAGLTKCAKQRLLTRGAAHGKGGRAREKPPRQPSDEISCVVIAEVLEAGQGYCFASLTRTFSCRVMTYSTPSRTLLLTFGGAGVETSFAGRFFGSAWVVMSRSSLLRATG